MKNKNLYIFTSAGPMATKLDGMMAYDEVSTCNGHMAQESLEEQNRLISISTRPIPIKLDKVVYYGNEPPRTKSHDTLITWSHVVSWQMKNVISPIARVLSVLNLTGWWCMTWGFHSKSYITLSKKFLPFIYFFLPQ